MIDGSDHTRKLRGRVSALLFARSEILTADAAAAFPQNVGTIEAGLSGRLAERLVQLLTFTVRDGHTDASGAPIDDLSRLVLERDVSVDRLFGCAYVVERTALDELAINQDIGATSEAWPIVLELVRHASFDLLAAFTEHVQLRPSGSAITDGLTALYSRPMFEAVLDRELNRAHRLGYEMSLILFDVDRLSTINRELGYGVGDRILERIGILIGTYFRRYDWVARYSEDRIVVLLARTSHDAANQLAEQVQRTVEERLEFLDHRTERPVRVTLRAAVLNIPTDVEDPVDPGRVLAQAETALERAKQPAHRRLEPIANSAARTS